MTLSDQMVEAAARALRLNARDEAGLPHDAPGDWETAPDDIREYWLKRARASLIAALALAEEAGALLVRVPTNADQWDSPGYDHGTPPNIIWADGHNAHRAATLAGRVWP